jgi:hypothetical protein
LIGTLPSPTFIYSATSKLTIRCRYIRHNRAHEQSNKSTRAEHMTQGDVVHAPPIPRNQGGLPPAGVMRFVEMPSCETSISALLPSLPLSLSLSSVVPSFFSKHQQYHLSIYPSRSILCHIHDTMGRIKDTYEAVELGHFEKPFRNRFAFHVIA